MDKYIEALFEKVENTIFRDAYGEKYADYSSGIGMLLDIFSKHKSSKTNIYFIGNGGSAAIASHMTADFMKNGGMITCSLYDNALTTCMGNDYGYEDIFSRPLNFLGKEGDLLVAISSSGNSENIVRAVDVATNKGIEVITMTGFAEDSRLRQKKTTNVYVPSDRYGMVETIHCMILQQIVDTITERDGVML